MLSLANPASLPEAGEISTQLKKRKRNCIEQDSLKEGQKRTRQQIKHLTAEDRDEEYIVTGCLGTGHIETPDFQAEQFENRYLEEEDFSVGQSEPEYFTMDEGSASVAGSNMSIISNRPILEAKPPSRRISRSTSPIRSTLAVLRSAAPSIEICQPGPAAATSPNEAVNRLKGFLLDGYDKAFIPRQLEVCIFTQFPASILTPSYRSDYVALLRMKLLSCMMQCSTSITDTHLKSLTRCGRTFKTYVMRPMHVAIS
jgi:hypothetical protein